MEAFFSTIIGILYVAWLALISKWGGFIVFVIWCLFALGFWAKVSEANYRDEEYAKYASKFVMLILLLSALVAIMLILAIFTYRI